MNDSNTPQGNAVQAPRGSQASQAEDLRDKLFSYLPEPTNVTGWERLASIGGGALLVARGLRKGGIFGIANLAMGAAAVYRGVTGTCEMKKQISRKMG